MTFASGVGVVFVRNSEGADVDNRDMAREGYLDYVLHHVFISFEVLIFGVICNGGEV